MSTTFQGRSLNRAAFQLYLDSLRDKVEKQIDEVSSRSPPRQGYQYGGASGRGGLENLIVDDDEEDDALEAEIERLYAQHRRGDSRRPGSASRSKSASRRRPAQETHDPHSHRQVQLVRPRSAHARPKKKKPVEGVAKTARDNYADGSHPTELQVPKLRTSELENEGDGRGDDILRSEKTTVGTLEHQVSREVFGDQTEGAYKKNLKKKVRSASARRTAENAQPEPPAKPVPAKRPPSAQKKGGVGLIYSGKIGRDFQKNVSHLVRTVLNEVNSLEKDVVDKIKDLNEYCEKMKWDRKYQPQYKSKLEGSSREIFRVGCVDTKTEVVVRDMSVELFIKEYRKVREIFKEWERMEESKSKVMSPRRRPSDRKKETHDDIRIVLLETVQLTKKLRDQVMEMERKGGNFSPFA